MTDFHRLPGKTPHIETALARGELITSVVLPPPSGGIQFYRKVRGPAAYAFCHRLGGASRLSAHPQPDNALIFRVLIRHGSSTVRQNGECPA